MTASRNSKPLNPKGVKFSPTNWSQLFFFRDIGDDQRFYGL